MKKAERACEKENFSQLLGISIEDLEFEVDATKQNYEKAKKAVEEAKTSFASFEAQATAAFLAEAAADPSTTTSSMKL